jgi:hypothetical protein
VWSWLSLASPLDAAQLARPLDVDVHACGHGSRSPRRSTRRSSPFLLTFMFTTFMFTRVVMALARLAARRGSARPSS